MDISKINNVNSIATTKAPARVYDIDWLRVIAMATILLFHCGRFFNNEGWHVKKTKSALG